VSYRRESAGHKVITFQNDEVVAIAEVQEGNARPPFAVAVPPARAAN
jgi:hypothetical protein